MSKKFYIARIINFFKENGFTKTINRFYLKIKQSILQNRDILFYSEIANFNEQDIKMPPNLKVICVTSVDEILPEDMDALIEYRGEKIVRQQIEERFSHGAVLYIVKCDGALAGFSWIIREVPIEHFYFPLTNNDAYFFDTAILPKYRGRGVLPPFSRFRISELKKQGILRAFFGTHEWNTPMIRAVMKTMAFVKFGVARKFHILGKDIVIWNEMCNRKKHGSGTESWTLVEK